jgi:hypothetical protein
MALLARGMPAAVSVPPSPVVDDVRKAATFPVVGVRRESSGGGGGKGEVQSKLAKALGGLVRRRFTGGGKKKGAGEVVEIIA